MSDAEDRRQFWDEEAPTARFSHPLNRTWLERAVRPQAEILDYGCGYGRTLAALREIGFQNVTGLDISPGMLERARSALNDVKLVLAEGFPSPFEDDAFELVILFAVLTSIPEDPNQRLLIRDVLRILRPGGYLYVSDLPLQRDARRIARYDQARPERLPYGTFLIDGGRATMRHHTTDWFVELFSDFERIDEASITVATMRGQTADAVQYLLRKRKI